jgi:GT2 family glycosyltransferase/glycosyltransferase involved in cell wall biosynthesis
MSNIFKNILVSAPNKGGLIFIKNGKPLRLDGINTTGLFFSNSTLLRGIQPNSLFIYGEKTFVLNNSSIAFDDIHDVLLFDENLFIVGTAGNEIISVDLNGTELQRWIFPGENDARHVNCLGVWNKNIIFSAFGDFLETRSYKGKTTGAGYVQDLMSGNKLITGLAQPHSLYGVGENLLVANSEKKQLLEYSSSGALLRSKQLNGYTRGICISEDVIYIGLSRSRNVEEHSIDTATIVALDLTSWDELDRMPLPVDEIYSIVSIREANDIVDIISAIAERSSLTYEEHITSLNHTISQQREHLVTVNQEAGQRDNLVVELSEKIQAVSTWATELQKSLIERDEQITAATQSLAGRDNQVIELNAKIQETSNWAMQLQQAIVERDKQIIAIAQRDDLMVELNAKIREVSDWGLQLQQSIVERDNQINSSRQAITQRDNLVAELNAKIHDVSDWVAQLQKSIAMRDNQAATTNQILMERESTILDLNTKILDAYARETRLKQTIDEQDSKIIGIQHVVTERDSRIEEFNVKIHDVSERATQLQQSVVERDKQITSTYDALAQRDNAIVELNAKIHEVSDWASRIDSNPFTYGYKKYAFNLARRIYRLFPMEIKAKQKLRDSFLSTSKKLYRKLKVPLKSSLAKPSRQVAEILAIAPPAKNRDIFVFSVIDWHFRIQRPQHLARSFASTGRRVFFFSNHFVDDSEPGYQIEQLDSSTPLYQIKLHVKGAPAIYFEPPTPEAEAMLKASITRLIIDFGATSTVSLIQHAYWYSLAKQLPNTYRTYDCMDHHDGFGNVPEKLNAIEKDMLRETDLVVVTSTWLENFAHSYNSNVSLIRNAGEFDHFSTIPNTVYVDTLGRKIIGYYGAIADWFDLDLIRKVAINYPDCLVLLVGSDTVSAGSALSDLQNVMLTGEIPYRDLPFYLHAFDVCLLPFKVIPLTLATNPVKVYEYLSAGKAVVCVNLPEISQFGGVVWRADTPAEFIAQIAQALSSDENSLEHINARLAFACNQTWSHRIAELNTAFDKLSWPKISVIVLTYNNLDLTKACLESIIEETDYPNLEIIVVDNASADDTPDYLRQFTARHPDVKIKLNKKNLGFAAGNNVGLAAATGDYLVLLNNDTVVTRGWALTLLRHLQADPSIGLIGPTTNNIGNEARIVMKYDDIAHMPLEALNLTLSNMGKLLPMRNAAFFCAMFPRSTYETCGPICEDYGRGFFEDDDYCRRVEAVGLRIVCADDVFIHHHLSASFNKLKDSEKQELFARNKIIYEEKWGPWIPHAYRS